MYFIPDSITLPANDIKYYTGFLNHMYVEHVKHVWVKTMSKQHGTKFGLLNCCMYIFQVNLELSTRLIW